MKPYISVTFACCDGTFADSRSSQTDTFDHAGICLGSALTAYCRPLHCLAEAVISVMDECAMAPEDSRLGQAEIAFCEAAEFLDQAQRAVDAKRDARK